MYSQVEARLDGKNIELDKFKDQNFILSNKLNEKEANLKILKIENERLSFDVKSNNKIFVLYPNKGNIELNNELNATREIISKISKSLNNEKVKNTRSTEIIENLKKENEILKFGKMCFNCIERENNSKTL